MDFTTVLWFYSVEILALKVFLRLFSFEGSSRPKVVLEDTGLKVKEYLGFKVLVGKEGNSFYGSRSGGTTVCKRGSTC